MALPKYLSDNEISNNKIIHLLAFASKDPSKKIDNPATGAKDLPIQDVNGVPVVTDPTTDPISTGPLATVAETFRTAVHGKIKDATA